MKPAYLRRIRRKPAASNDNPVFRKEGQTENTFFGETAPGAFFQPTATIQRKCAKCEDEDKQAHELTHVVQQSKGAQGSKSVQRKDAKPAKPKQPVVVCDRSVVAAVRQEAFLKAQVTMFRLRGVHPNLGAYQQREAYNLARRTISRSLSLDQTIDIIEKMVTVLSSNERVECGPEIDACSDWNAYVVGNRPPMHTCNKFFDLSHDEQVKTILHEAAHAVGIGEPGKEAYIFGFDCSNPTLGSFDTADSWAYFVLCASHTT
ncbi:hypothetical protein D3H65_07310 [Paraflavitalea soli]|uniref:Lysine-specific metallo-endopeptidase domain-containing protein n=1 Tax=Paraflavitalea soli TaxID=2315862 RepID=A0A3B7MLA6_9BACT|nr:M35 family metallo-endopeptidase [Paraflavitalea soli]AXY73796.1 hypothetical protein D3H65_07310 [Paraflavitalea soli]